MFTHSIRSRLQLWLAFLLVCILIGFGATASQLHRVNQWKRIDEELGLRVTALSGVAHGRRLFGDRLLDFRLSTYVASLFADTDTNSFYYVIWSQDGRSSSTNAPGAVPLPQRLADTRPHVRARGTYRELFLSTESGDCVLAGRSIAADLEEMRHFTWWLLAAGGTVLALGLGGGWWLARRAVDPLKTISAAANRISGGNLSERINVAETDGELGSLAGVLNSTFARLEAAFAQQAQFTADASHELRTPLAVLITEAQTALTRARSAAEYRSTVKACLNTAQQMRRLTESLLELSRFDAGQETLQRRSVDLAETTRACVEVIRPLAEHRGITVDCDLAPAEIPGDPVRLNQVITNLLSNALHYNKPCGEIHVSTRTENGAAVVTIADSGIGIAADDLPHIFDRFYRANGSHARSRARSGIGLAICKAIVDAHNGNIEVSSQHGEGTAVILRLPRGDCVS